MYGLVTQLPEEFAQSPKEAIELTCWDDAQRLMLHIATTDIDYVYPGERHVLIVAKKESARLQTYLKENSIQFVIKKVHQRWKH